jgi:superkiller protein 3
MLVGNADEARALLTQANALSESTSTVVRRQFPASVFDHVLAGGGRHAEANVLLSLLDPLFALDQVKALQPQDHAAAHLSGLLRERVGDMARVTTTLEAICDEAEADYEASESADSLARFALAKTDVARAYLADRRFDDAVEAADTALSLSSDEADNELTGEQRKRARLSANLTVGLARYYQKEVTESVASFEAALEESGGDSDAVCLLAQVLWAVGGDEHRARARTSLKELSRREPQHVQCNMLLSVMALMSGDAAAMAFAQRKLQKLRTSPQTPLTDREHGHVGLVLGALARQLGGEQAVLAHVQTDALLAPYRSQAWTQLVALGGGAAAAGTALGVAERGVRMAAKTTTRTTTTATTDGLVMDAEALATTLAGTGRVRDAQRSIVLAPWTKGGWRAFAQGLRA